LSAPLPAYANPERKPTDAMTMPPDQATPETTTTTFDVVLTALSSAHFRDIQASPAETIVRH
jgi:hypothetical protein